MKYVGARYVPKFMGSFDNTQSYEALCVVDNGMGTSYISKKPTPAGTPLTNTEYWAVYGASSGAIVNLQTQIDDITKYDVTKYGAKGDGITEDTQAFVDCLTAHDICYIPAGTYLINNLEIISDKTLIGDSAADVTLKLLNNADNPLMYANAASNVTLKNITFDGNKGNQTSPANLVSFVDGSHLEITDCIFKDARGSNLYILRTTFPHISNCIFSGSYAGCGIILTYNDNPQYGLVEHVYCHDNEVDGITCTGQYNIVRDSVFDHNGLQALPGTLPSCGIYLDSHSDYCTISNNKCSRNSFSGIELSGTDHTVVSDNICIDNDANGIYCGEASYNIITGNRCYNNKGTGNTLYGGIYVGRWSTSDTCVKNIIANNYIDAGSLTEYGIILNNATTCTAIGNDISFSTTKKVYNNDTSNTILNDRSENIVNNDNLTMFTNDDNVANIFTYSSSSKEDITFNKPDLYIKYSSGGNVNLHVKGLFADAQIETSDYVRAGNIEVGGTLNGKGTGYLLGFNNMRLPSAADDYQQGNVYVDTNGLHVYYNGAWHTVTAT